MPEDYFIWKKNLYGAINDISSLQTQKELWLGGNPNYISSYVEVINTLYDDFDFERFIGVKWNNFGLSTELHDLLNELDNMLNLYVNKVDVGLSDSEILHDSKWISITKKAQEVINQWNKEEPSIAPK